MFLIFKDSSKLLNTHIKDIFKFFTFTSIASIISSVIFPIGGFALSIGIFIYINQVILQFVKTEYLNIEDYEEPFYSGIIKVYIFKILSGLPIVISIFYSLSFLLKGIILTAFSSIYVLNFQESFYTIVRIFLAAMSCVFITFLIMQLLFPFTQFVFLDDEFTQNSFFKNIQLSLNLAKGYRLNIFCLLIINCIFTVFSIFTFGLSLIYTYPLYVIVLSKFYLKSKAEYVF